MVRAIGLAVMVALALAVAGCDPDITGGAYICGPQLACPDDYACDQVTALCVRPSSAQPFACAEGAEAGEPNDDPGFATPILLPACPGNQVERLGCLPAAADFDWLVIDGGAACAGAPVTIEIRYAAAFAPAVVDETSPTGTVIAGAEQCGVAGDSGINDAKCLDTTLGADGRVMLRVGLDPELDCDGACDFTNYSVTARASAPP
jgi:hypothetical protein